MGIFTSVQFVELQPILACNSSKIQDYYSTIFFPVLMIVMLLKQSQNS